MLFCADEVLEEQGWKLREQLWGGVNGEDGDGDSYEGRGRQRS